MMLIIWLLFTFGLLSQLKLVTAETDYSGKTVNIDSSNVSGDLMNGELSSREPKKLQILKKISRTNHDGSFVIGYEAVDGTFEIESRERKERTYDNLDKNSEIKRVFYTANNTKSHGNMNDSNKSVLLTAFQSTKEEDLGNTTSTNNSNSNIAQAKSKRRFILPFSPQVTKKHQNKYLPNFITPEKTEDIQINIEKNKMHKSEPTSVVIYATPVESSITPSASKSSIKTNSRSKNVHISGSFSKVLNMNGYIKIVNDSKENDGKSERGAGNIIRRQLPNDQSENFPSNSQIIYSHSSDEDLANTQRKIISTTNSPHLLPLVVLTARNRASMLKNSALQSTSSPEKLLQNNYQKNIGRPDGINSNTGNDFSFTRSAVQVRIPANRAIQKDNGHIYRHPSAHLHKMRQQKLVLESDDGPKKLPVETKFQQREIESEQYLRETLEPIVKDSTSSKFEHLANNERNAATHTTLQSLTHPRLFGVFRTDIDQRFQQQSPAVPISMHPYLSNNPQYTNYFDRLPLTAKDFERLLNLLVFRHHQYQRLNFFTGGTFNGHGNYFPGYNPYQNHIISSLYNQFDPRYSAFSRSLIPLLPPHSFLPPYSEQENMYQAQNLKQYYTIQRNRPIELTHQKISQENTEYLPSNVREELLYRMLMLAIQPDITTNIASLVNDASTTQEYFNSNAPEKFTNNLRKPVRSVQILGDEETSLNHH